MASANRDILAVEQHREIERVQPKSRLTPEEEKLHAKFKEPR